MLISELIQKLEAIKSVHGDLQAYLWSIDMDDPTPVIAVDDGPDGEPALYLE